MRHTLTNYTSIGFKGIALLLTFLFIGISTPSQAQELDSEAGFIYLKAKYLFETDRHDDAIREFNKVIKKVADYEDAMVIRAKSKFALAAYKGAELDALEYIKLKGITPDVSVILGKAQYQLENYEAAKNTLITAVQLNPTDADPLELLAKMADEDGELLTACKYWTTAAKLGSSKAQVKAKQNCGEVVEAEIKQDKEDSKEDIISIGTKLEEDLSEELEADQTGEEKKESDETDEDEGKISVGSRLDETKVDVSKTNTTSSIDTIEVVKLDDGRGSKTEKIEDQVKIQKPKVSEVEVKVEEPEDDTPRVIEIDEELTLQIFGQGLGQREIVNTPNILILSEDDGKVAIDICVNKQGKVESAEFNSDLSTIGKKSLISLAIRKSKDFWFEKDRKRKEHCGVIVFDIKGS